MYVHRKVPEEEIVYLEVVEDIKDNLGDLNENPKIPIGSITWIRKSEYATHLKSNILMIEDNCHMFNFHKDCFKEIPNPYVEKEIKKDKKVWRFLTEKEAELSAYGMHWSDVQKTHFGKQIPEKYWKECEDKGCISLDMSSFHHSKYTDKPLPKEEKGEEDKKREYKFSVGQEVQIRDGSEFSEQGRSKDGTKMKGKISKYEEDSEFKYRVEWQKNRENVYREEDLEPYQEPKAKTESKTHGFKVGDIIKIRKDSILLRHGKDEEGNRKIGKILEIGGPNTCSMLTVRVKFSGVAFHEGFRLEDLEHCTEPYPEEEKKGVNIGKNFISGIDPATPGDSSSLMSYRTVTLDLEKEEKKLHPDVSRMKSI